MDYPNNITEFVDYVDSFYGTNDPLYPLMSNETKQPLGKLDILRATLNYIDLCMKGDLEYVHYKNSIANEFCWWWKRPAKFL